MLTGLDEAGAAAWEAVQAARTAVRAALAQRTLALANRTELKTFKGAPVPVPAEKLNELADKLANAFEAALAGFDSTPVEVVAEPHIQPSRAERGHLWSQMLMSGGRWTREAAWLWRLEREEGFKHTALSRQFPEPPVGMSGWIRSASDRGIGLSDLSEAEIAEIANR